jgi:aspartate/methionine/tyrosine aminotransferase
VKFGYRAQIHIIGLETAETDEYSWQIIHRVPGFICSCQADNPQPVIHLGGGEPKNKALVTAILGSAAKLKAGDIKYAPTDGLPSLKKAIIRYTEENYGRPVAPDNIIVSNGAGTRPTLSF